MIDHRRAELRPESDARPRVSDTRSSRRERVGTGRVFVLLAPLVVVLVGFAVVLSIGVVGLDALARAGDKHAQVRADLIATTVASRLAQLPESRRLEAVQLAGRRTATELLLVTADAKVIYDVTLGAPDRAALEEILREKKGIAVMRLGRAHFSVQSIGAAARLIVFVTEPSSPPGAPALVSALVALAVLLLGTAAGVAFAVSRDVTRDVDFVTHRVREMARVRTKPTGELIPTRTLDEVGLLTAAFNKLVGRFDKARIQYREDLDRAHAADRERAAFLAAVSHELRSPLNAILGFADILMEEVDGPLDASARDEVEQIRGSGVHLLGLINDILELSALESGQLRLTRDRIDLVGLASEVVREARGLIGDRQIALYMEAGVPVFARVDGRRVRQVLSNLVNNAIKFTQRGEVVVRITEDRGTAILSVSDTGPGISAQERAHIFGEFKQAGGERQRRRGTGLGLAIAKRLVVLHHGSIQVDSELGRGSTFKVFLPIGNSDVVPPSRSSRPPSVRSSRSSEALPFSRRHR